MGRAVCISSSQHTSIYNSPAYSCTPIHSMSLGTDPPSKPQPSNFLYLPDNKRLTKFPRHTKSRDNSNMLHIINNSTYSDFRTDYKHVVIPSYQIRVNNQKQNITKLNRLLGYHKGQDQHLKWNSQSHILL